MRPDLYAPGSAYHVSRRWTQKHAVRCLEAACTLLGQPASLLDIGCAEGGLVLWATGRGIDAMGIDLAAPEDPALVRADLRAPVDLRRTFDWVLCWEVAEHLPSSAADTLVETVIRHLSPTGRVLFTAARPGQVGPGHINLQTMDYWAEKFYALGGLVIAEQPSLAVRKAWLKAAPKTPWYGRNCCVYWRVA